MASALDLLQSLNALDVEKEALVSISRTAESYVDLNRKQLLSGKKSDGTAMPPYSKASVELYGKPSGPILLYDTGAFQESFKLDVSSTGLEVVANDIHYLARRYTDNIYGLTKQSQETYNQDNFRPEFENRIEDITGLKFN